jgi:potassium-transporting ATPase potassium-binding subunit
MTAQASTQLIIFFAVLIALAYPLAAWMARVGDSRPIGGFVGKFERLIYRGAGVDPAEDMPWTRYAIAVTCCSACRLAAAQSAGHSGNVSPDSSFNTAVSFVTNTNWQGYSGESTMSYLTQMAGSRCRTSFGGHRHRGRLSR